MLQLKSKFRSGISKIHNTFIYNAADLINLVISMYNLLEYNGNYPKTSGKVWSYYKDEINDAGDNN